MNDYALGISGQESDSGDLGISKRLGCLETRNPLGCLFLADVSLPSPAYWRRGSVIVLGIGGAYCKSVHFIGCSSCFPSVSMAESVFDLHTIIFTV